jgi:hypothetical protein
MKLNLIRHLNIGHFIVFSMCIASSMFFLADRNGYEGDDMNIICAMFNLDAGLQGAIDVYRYSWQPLGYWIGVAVYKLTGSPTAIFMLAPLAGTISLTLLVAYMSKAASQRHGILCYLAILILIPELWFSGLYYNTSIIAMPLVVFAALLLYENPSFAQILLAGVLVGLAVLIRLDFVLACPMFAVILWHQRRSLKLTFLLAFAVCSVLALALVIQLVTLEQVVADYQRAHTEMVERGQSGGWNLYTKAWVTMMALHPAGWLLLIVGGPLTVRQFWRKDPSLTIIYGVAAVLLLYPLPNLLSVKYLLPLMIFLPVFFVHCLEHLSSLLADRYQRFAEIGMVAIAIIALTVSFEPQSHVPFIRVVLSSARQVGTHDGNRSFGAYLIQMFRVDRMVEVNDYQRTAEELLQFMQKSTGPDVLIAGFDSYFLNGSIGWSYFQLLAENANVHGSVVGDHLLFFKFGFRHLWVSAYPEKALRQITSEYQTSPLVIDVRNDKLTSREVYSAVHDAIQSEK